MSNCRERGALCLLSGPSGAGSDCWTAWIRSEEAQFFLQRGSDAATSDQRHKQRRCEAGKCSLQIENWADWKSSDVLTHVETLQRVESSGCMSHVCLEGFSEFGIFVWFLTSAWSCQCCFFFLKREELYTFLFLHFTNRKFEIFHPAFVISISSCEKLSSALKWNVENAEGFRGIQVCRKWSSICEKISNPVSVLLDEWRWRWRQDTCICLKSLKVALWCNVWLSVERNDQEGKIPDRKLRTSQTSGFCFQRTGQVWIISISAMMRTALKNVLDLIHMSDVTPRCT